MPGGGNLVRSERFRKAPRTPRTPHARYYYTRSLVLDSPIRKRSNTPRIRCQSAPKVMDSHSRSASPREPMRPQHRPPSPPSSPSTPVAFDNQAYQHDESDQNHNDSFSSNGPQQNGHTKEPNGVSDAKTLEAVNLELINLTPKNGSAKKKDVEVDMNASNPYDEYFVPVNEHRKYMRGEKLYVTADKRGEKGGCKRPLCWTLLGLIVAAIVAIIVLAATGILFTNSPTPLEQYNTSVSSARALGGIGHVHQDHEHDHDHHDHDHSSDHEHNTEPTELQHGPDVQSDEGHEPSIVSEEANDSSMYVPRTVEGELKVDNEDYTAALQDPESNEYREFVSTFTDGIKRALFDRNSLDNGDNEIIVEVVQLRQGSVIVTYRIHWKAKNTNTEPSEDLLNTYKLETKLEDYLIKNNRMISVYHIAENNLATRPVLDICQINKNGCEYECEFDKITLDFTCTCPYGQIMDMANPKRCMSVLDSENGQKSNEDTKNRDLTVLNVNFTPVTTKMIPEEEKPATESVHIAKQTFDWKETHHRMPETTTEVETDVNFSHIFGHPTEKQMEHDHEPEHEPEPEPEHEPEPPKSESSEDTAAPEPSAEPEPEPPVNPEPTAAEPASEPTAKPESKYEPEPEPKSEPEPTSEPDSEPKSEPEPEPKLEPELKPEPKLEPEPEPEPEPTTTTQSAEHVALNPAFMLQEEQQSQPHSTSEPEPILVPGTELEPSQTTPRAKPSFETHNIIEAEIRYTTENQAESEPEPVPVTEKPNHTTMADINQESEHHTDQSGNSEEKSILYTNEGKFEYKPNEEIESPETTTIRISISEPNLINEPSYEPKPEIISILSDAKKPEHPTTPISEAPTTEITDWLELQSQNNMKTDHQNHTDFEKILNNNVNKIMHESEERSFKTFDVDFAFETTTATNTNTTNEDYSLDSITKDSATTGTVITRRMEEEAKMPVSILPASEENAESDIVKIETATQMASAASSAHSDMSKSDTETESTITENEETPETEKGSMITYILEEAKSLDTNKTVPNETTTSEPETVKQFSINKHYQDSDEDKLIEVLENKPHSEINETSTEREPEEGMDITFDAINMLFNRSSKSIENQPETNGSNNGILDTTEDNEPMGETTGISTDSDWLSEPVTEVNYYEAMNKMEKHETTESTVNKIEEIMNHGQVKDDFEPDYLNNMGPNSSKQEQDEPLYGMVHDYDNEDTRFKRVNKEVTMKTAKNISTEIGESTKEVTKSTFESIPKVSIPIETTTVSEYIYKVAEHSFITEPGVTLMVHNESTIMNSSSIMHAEPAPDMNAVPIPDVNSEPTPEVNVHQTPVMNTEPAPVMTTELTAIINAEPAPVINTEPVTVMNAEPAPVWEDLDAEKGLNVKELPNKVEENLETKPVMIDEIQTPSTAIVPINNVNEMNNNVNESFKNGTITDGKSSDLSENSTQNTTQLNNLNVTIYELTTHTGNNSVLLAKATNAQSAEYDDHETEMNPFLPEVENNKSLVKKLQEGHDLEPTNLTETQNENTEDHAINSLEGQTSSSQDSLAVLAKDTNTKMQEESPPTTTEDDTSFNELLMHVNSNENATEVIKGNNMNVTKITTTIEKPEKKETLPISSFLMDTDDLVTSREPSTTISANISVNTTPSLAVPNNDSEFLSVVPIEEEKEDLLQKQRNQNIEELNDISDLPKSDKRTLDATKFDSVINNEA